jgi:hypothetical protein
MFKEYLKFFLTGNSNDLSSVNFAQDFEKNFKGEITQEQANYIQKILKVERNSNLFFALIANFFMAVVFCVSIANILTKSTTTPECIILEDGTQFCSDPYENNNDASVLIITSAIFVQVIIVLGIIFKLILPYTKNRLLKVYNTNGKLKKSLLEYDTANFYILKISNTRFNITQNLFDMFIDNENYSVNYIKTPRQNIILSFRLLILKLE